MENTVKFISTTQAKYDALVSKDAGSLYFTSDTHRIYKGSELFSISDVSNLATKSDATLTPVYEGGEKYGDWELNPQISYQDAYPVSLRLTGHGWEPYAQVDDGHAPPYDVSVGSAKGDSDSVELSWTAMEDGLFTFTATRALNQLIGYQLGDQVLKPVASEAEVIALRAKVAALEDAIGQGLNGSY